MIFPPTALYPDLYVFESYVVEYYSVSKSLSVSTLQRAHASETFLIRKTGMELFQKRIILGSA